MKVKDVYFSVKLLKSIDRHHNAYFYNFLKCSPTHTSRCPGILLRKKMFDTEPQEAYVYVYVYLYLTDAYSFKVCHLKARNGDMEEYSMKGPTRQNAKENT